MRRHDDGAGGFFLVMETTEELAELEEDLRKQISPRLTRWQKKPAEIAKDLSGAKLPAIRELGKSLGARVVHIELHVPDPIDPYSGSVARARFVRAQGEDQGPGLVGPDPRAVARLPASCPAPLRELYAQVGAIDLARQTSGSIVDPGSLASATSILDEVGAVSPAWLSETRAQDAHSFWEIGDDALCWRRDGGTIWIRRQPTDWSFTPGPDIEDAIAGIFSGLLAGEAYRA